MLKHQELSDPTSCINKAADNEPVFVLRANDPLASRVIRYWASLAPAGGHELSKAVEAMQVATLVDSWRLAKGKHVTAF